MLKTGYVRTEINKWIWDREETGVKVNAMFIINSLDDIYELLNTDPERPLGGCSLKEFKYWAKRSYEVSLLFQASW